MIRRFRYFALSFLVTAVITKAGYGQSIPEQDIAAYADKIDELVTSYHKYGMFQGAIMIAMDGKIIYRKAFGMADMEWQILNTPETKFEIASLGKAFTAAIVLQLVEEGRVRLNDPLSKHLLAYRKDIGSKVTIHHLMSHSAGIPWGPDHWSYEKFTQQYTLADLVEIANQQELEFEPGSQFSYCNSCYNLLGALIEEVTGSTFEEALQKRILDPLGMKNTGLVKLGPILEKRAKGYTRLATGEYVNAPSTGQDWAKGAGGMYSTVDDLYKWDRALYNDDLLSPESRQAMFTSHIRTSGYGWSVGAYVKNGVEGRGIFASGFGGTSGFASLLARCLDDRYFIVALGNMRPIPQGQLGNRLWNTILGFDEEPPLPPVSEPIFQKLMDQGIEAAVEKYRKLKAISKASNVPSKSAINSAAFYYLESNRSAEAITVCRFNLALHPDYANAYARLGDIYKQQGDRERAINNYRKAIELDPAMSNVARALEKLID